ncbi:DUF2252 domain-containing protein [Glaciimonas soli]|uniref:DUF2252 domain-containing protein n=1 Tax=Glaciimonas soli TaxID=2590999 RepID=A0A843YNQ8_9BURK|nr:DUF2252 domain-containing protein [Glaciimonas soli]MQR01479.1 DUF2252 domain-containing protein [Glaciimonas soli]
MVNVVRRIQEYNVGRDPDRLSMKYKNMRSSPFVFLRGTCHLFYENLPKSGIFKVGAKSAPLAWICGDMHLENFGSYKGDNRLVYFDMNDFDEASLAPATWEIVRLLTSIQIGAASFSASLIEANKLCQDFLDAYIAALSLGKPRWVERDTAVGIVGSLLNSLRERQRSSYLDSRTERKGRARQRVIRIDGKKALAVTDKQRAKVTTFMEKFAAEQGHPDFYKVLDVARRIAGTGSLGVERYIILVQGKGSPNGNYLLDLKQAAPCSLAAFLKVPQPKWSNDAERVVTIQRRVQAVSMAFLQAVTIGKKSYILRGLQPTEDRVSLDRATRSMDELKAVMQTMGHLVAWGQLRSSGRAGSAIADDLIAFAQNEKWKKQMLIAAHDCAAQVNKDWKTYSKAYDDGEFEV